jgi:spermidine/putrescine transport system ATP-binding protein
MATQSYDVILENVSKSYHKTRAVDRVSLNVKQGTFLTLLGPSGCGKTTTLRLIGGLETPDEGRILIKGRDVTHIPPYKRETNLVFQDFALFPHMNVFNNIAFGLRMSGVDRKEIDRRVHAMLEMVGLPEVLHRRPNQLSGGQRQRVALCRALILEPAVLLLDEPLGALDAKIRKQMQAELKNLQVKLGRAFISVTHDQEEAMTMSDEIAIMNNGKIEQVGTPLSIYERPVSRFVATFLGDCNLIDVIVQNVAPDMVTLRSNLGDFFFTPPTAWQPIVKGAAASLMIRPENIHIEEVNPAMVNRVQGIVSESIFKGSNTEYQIRVNSTHINVQVQGRSNLKQGQSVTAAWRSVDCYLFS